MSLTLITGKAIASSYQLSTYLKNINNEAKLNCTIDELANMYIEEGNVENIRGDIAFAQACVETGYFKYGGIVLWAQNNYCGLGALDSNTTGQAATFESPRIGIRAQIQHLKAYANNESLVQQCVDPRFKYVQRGCSQYVEYLGQKENPTGKGWATGANYGSKILSVLNNILKISDTNISTNQNKILYNGNIITVDQLTSNNKTYISLDSLKDILNVSYNDTFKMTEISMKPIRYVG